LFIDTLISNGCDLVTKKVNIGPGSYPELVNAIDLADKYGIKNFGVRSLGFGVFIVKDEVSVYASP